MSKDLQADLLADLTAQDLSPTPEAPEPAPLPQALSDVTPAVNLQWTPLRWSRPKVVRAKDGPGKALRLGPLTLEVAVKE